VTRVKLVHLPYRRGPDRGPPSHAPVSCDQGPAQNPVEFSRPATGWWPSGYILTDYICDSYAHCWSHTIKEQKKTGPTSTSAPWRFCSSPSPDPVLALSNSLFLFAAVLALSIVKRPNWPWIVCSPAWQRYNCMHNKHVNLLRLPSTLRVCEEGYEVKNKQTIKHTNPRPWWPRNSKMHPETRSTISRARIRLMNPKKKHGHEQGDYFWTRFGEYDRIQGGTVEGSSPFLEWPCLGLPSVNATLYLPVPPTGPYSTKLE